MEIIGYIFLTLIFLAVAILMFIGFSAAITDFREKRKALKIFLKDAVKLEATVLELKRVKLDQPIYFNGDFGSKKAIWEISSPVLRFIDPDGNESIWDTSDAKYRYGFFSKRQFYTDVSDLMPPVPGDKREIYYNFKTGEKYFYYRYGLTTLKFILIFLLILFAGLIFLVISIASISLLFNS